MEQRPICPDGQRDDEESATRDALDAAILVVLGYESDPLEESVRVSKVAMRELEEQLIRYSWVKLRRQS
jgi:hypothetical protein